MRKVRCVYRFALVERRLHDKQIKQFIWTLRQYVGVCVSFTQSVIMFNKNVEMKEEKMSCDSGDKTEESAGSR